MIESAENTAHAGKTESHDSRTPAGLSTQGLPRPHRAGFDPNGSESAFPHGKAFLSVDFQIRNETFTNFLKQGLSRRGILWYTVCGFLCAGVCPRKNTGKEQPQ